MKWKAVYELVRDTVREWFESKTFQLGAALAYYGVFSIAPILVIAVAIAGALFGESAARGQVATHLRETFGPAVADAVQQALGYVHTSGSSGLASALSVLVLLFGAIGFFAQLQAALDTIWNVMPKPGRGLWGVVADRLISFLMVLLIAALLLLSLLASAVLAAMDQLLTATALPGGVYLWRGVHWVVSLGLLTLLFALLYKIMPDVKIAWRAVWVGAAVTALLFTVGSYLIGLYLGRASVTSAYGAAGSLVIILLWVYYSSQIVLLGAEFTRLYADRYGQPAQPADNAVPMTAAARIRQGTPSPGDAQAALRA